MVETFDANYILVLEGGHLQIGTYDKPFESNLTITIHGKKYVNPLPGLGNKFIGSINGIIDIHG